MRSAVARITEVIGAGNSGVIEDTADSGLIIETPESGVIDSVAFSTAGKFGFCRVSKSF
jgi:hypothetical protein